MLLLHLLLSLRQMSSTDLEQQGNFFRCSHRLRLLQPLRLGLRLRLRQCALQQQRLSHCLRACSLEAEVERAGGMRGARSGKPSSTSGVGLLFLLDQCHQATEQM